MNKEQKLFRFEVDQSIRVEELAKDTIIGLANLENSFTIKIPVEVKRKVYSFFKRTGRPKYFGPSVFVGGIVLGIAQSKFRIAELVLDIEYPGYELYITKYVKRYFPEILVYFSVIGKKSPAHYAAYGVYKKKKTVDSTAKIEDFYKQKMIPELLH